MVGRNKDNPKILPPLRGCYAIAALLRMTGKGRSFPYGMLRNRFVRSIRQRIVILSEREGSRFQESRTNSEILPPLRGCYAIAALLRMTSHGISAPY